MAWTRSPESLPLPELVDVLIKVSWLRRLALPWKLVHTFQVNSFEMTVIIFCRWLLLMNVSICIGYGGVAHRAIREYEGKLI